MYAYSSGEEKGHGILISIAYFYYIQQINLILGRYFLIYLLIDFFPSFFQ